MTHDRFTGIAQGIHRLLDLGQYIQEEPNNPSPRVWANLAAALGQKYKYDQAHGVPQQSLNETRRRVLEATRNAVDLEPQMKVWLRTLWNRNDPTKVASEEDDLEVFFDDADVKKLLD